MTQHVADQGAHTHGQRKLDRRTRTRHGADPGDLILKLKREGDRIGVHAHDQVKTSRLIGWLGLGLGVSEGITKQVMTDSRA